MRRPRPRPCFRPSADALEPRNLLTTTMSPWAPGPPAPVTTHSGAQMIVGGGLATLQGSNNGDAVTVFPVDPSTVEVQVDNPQGTDAFLIPASDVLEVVGGTGANAFESTAGDTTIFIGGTGDNLAVGGTGFNFLVSTGGGSNDFTAGSGYTAFIASSAGSTTMHGGGAFNSASLCLGVNTLDQGAGTPTAVYCYGGSNTLNADQSPAFAELDVFDVAPPPAAVNAGNNPNVVVKHGLF